MGGCQNYGPFLGTLNNRCRIIIATQKGTIILTITQMLYKGSLRVLLGFKNGFAFGSGAQGFSVGFRF